MESFFFLSRLLRNIYASLYWEKIPQELTIGEKQYESTEKLPYEVIISTGKYIDGKKSMNVSFEKLLQRMKI